MRPIVVVPARLRMRRRPGSLALALLPAFLVAPAPGDAGALDRTVPLGFVRVPGGNHLLLIDPADGTTVTRIYAGSGPEALRTLPDRKRIWSCQPAAGTSALIEAATGRIEIFAPGDPVFTEDGGRCFFVDEGGVSEVDARDWRVLSRSDVALPPDGRVALTPDGARLLLLPGGEGAGPAGDSLLVWDTARRRIAARVAAVEAPADVVLEPGGRFAIVAGRSPRGLAAIDLALLAEAGPRAAGGARAVFEIPGPGPVRAVALRPDAKQMIVVADSDSGVVHSFRTEFPSGDGGAPAFRLERSATLGAPLLGGAFTPDGGRLYLLEGGSRGSGGPGAGGGPDEPGGRALVLNPADLQVLREIPGAGGEEIVWAEVPDTAVARLRREGPALRAASRGALRSMFLHQRGYRDLVLTEEVTEYGPDGAFLDQFEGTRRVTAGGLVREDSERGSTLWSWGRLVRTTRDDPIHSGDWLADFVYLWRTVPIDHALSALAGDARAAAGPRSAPGTDPLPEADSGPAAGRPRAGVALDILHRNHEGERPFLAIGAAAGDSISTQIEVDENTGFPRRIVLHRPFDPSVYVTRFEQYRVIDGHWIPARITDSIDGTVVRRRYLRRAVYDTGVRDAHLSAP